MGQSFQDSEKQRLLQVSVDLLNRLVEIQKLRVAVISEEASKRCNEPKVIAPPAGHQLRA
jgi:hypothetical protein